MTRTLALASATRSRGHSSPSIEDMHRQWRELVRAQQALDLKLTDMDKTDERGRAVIAGRIAFQQRKAKACVEQMLALPASSAGDLAALLDVTLWYDLTTLPMDFGGEAAELHGSAHFAKLLTELARLAPGVEFESIATFTTPEQRKALLDLEA